MMNVQDRTGRAEGKFRAGLCLYQGQIMIKISPNKFLTGYASIRNITIFIVLRSLKSEESHHVPMFAIDRLIVGLGPDSSQVSW
jgi:hypothetical protein